MALRFILQIKVKLNLKIITDCVEKKMPVFLFVSPETLVNFSVKEQLQRWNMKFLIIDECHLVEEWGKEFRPAFREILKIRNFVSCSLGAFTATLTDDGLETLYDVGMSKDAGVFAASPNRYALQSCIHLIQ